MLETVREYGLERLAASGDEADAHQAHARYYLLLAEQASAEWDTPNQGHWVVRLEAEHDNLGAALRWMWSREEYAAGLRLAAALWPFWHTRGYLTEGRSWLERLLAAGTNPSRVRAEALTGAAWLAHPQHDFAALIPLLEESAELRRDLGLPDGGTDLLIHRGLQARADGDYEQAVSLLKECVARHRAQGNAGGIGARGLGLSLFRLGMVLREQGDADAAQPLYEECLALHEGLGDPEGRAMSLLGLGDIARDRGDADGVRAHCQESLALFEEFGDRWGMSVSLNNLALGAYARGAFEQAAELAERSVSLARDIGGEPSIAENLITIGRVAAGQGDVTRSSGALAESLALIRVHGPQYLVPSILETLSTLSVIRGDMATATGFLAAASGLRVSIGAALPVMFRSVHDRTLNAARTCLDGPAFAVAWAAGERTTLEDAIDGAARYLAMEPVPTGKHPEPKRRLRHQRAGGPGFAK